MKQTVPGSHALCALSAARAAPLRVMCAGRALVVWVGADDRPAVLDDRCPHGNARLSAGYVVKGRIVCPQHMWSFGPDGQADAPGGGQGGGACMPRSYPCWVSDGQVRAILGPSAPDRGAATPV
ncbi:Rieske (2Fe-2S) protein [Komagataeibacter sp. FNDCR2]|uniref:Rieske (2Fe-2S) protein n=1 Tax=Komagataeibacter sp. FNDCR2 TaxID=2878682 RepID=UPI001E621EEF|nr:Rieske (2Fe-2S) protein [Komagataeibacter sp. FNDCR2]MCE2576187.1 Rieske (2Fe-2S) protein [Komagataeibacter sp. FNDCR2]